MKTAFDEDKTALAATLRPPARECRIPYDSGLQDLYGVDLNGWKIITEMIFPNAKSMAAIESALAYCKSRGLDVYSRPVHIVPMWSGDTRETIETVFPGIASLRMTAFKTGQYSGIDAAEFGPDITQTFKDGQGAETTVTFPEWCRITVWRNLNGARVPFVSPKVLWLESYGKWAGTPLPNDMWAKRAVGQIEKCAEAAGLRRAFPDEIGNDLTAEEMEGQRVGFAAPVTRKEPAVPLLERLNNAVKVKDGFHPDFAAAETAGIDAADAPPVENASGNVGSQEENAGAKVETLPALAPVVPSILVEAREAAKGGPVHFTGWLVTRSGEEIADLAPHIATLQAEAKAASPAIPKKQAKGKPKAKPAKRQQRIAA